VSTVAPTVDTVDQTPPSQSTQVPLVHTSNPPCMHKSAPLQLNTCMSLEHVGCYGGMLGGPATPRLTGAPRF